MRIFIFLTAVIAFVIVTAQKSHYDAPRESGMRWESNIDNCQLPRELSSVSGGVVGNYLYIFGRDVTAMALNDQRVHRYNIVTKLWDEAKSRPYGGNHHCTVIYQGKLWVFGGRYANSPGSLQVFDPVSNTWSIKKSFGWLAGAVNCGEINGMMYVAGGEMDGGGVSSLAVEYNPVTNSYRSLPDMPEGVHHASPIVFENKLWIFAGRPGGIAGKQGTDNVQVFDPAIGSWKTCKSHPDEIKCMPFPITAAGPAVKVGNKLLIFGGGAMNSLYTGLGNMSRYLHIYNPLAKSWSLGPDMITPREAIWPMRVGNAVFVQGAARSMTWDYTNICEALLLNISSAETDAPIQERSEDTDAPNSPKFEEPSEDTDAPVSSAHTEAPISPKVEEPTKAPYPPKTEKPSEVLSISSSPSSFTMCGLLVSLLLSFFLCNGK